MAQTYEMMNGTRGGFTRTIVWEAEHGDTMLEIEQIITYRDVYINVKMTPEQKALLEQKEKITLDDLNEFDWEFAGDVEDDTDWKIRGEVSPEVEQEIALILDENYYSGEECGWGEESDSGYQSDPDRCGLVFV